MIVESDGIELDVCAQGHGSWFDAQELGLLLQAAAGEEAPDAALERLENRLAEMPAQQAERRCPRCRRTLSQCALPGGTGPVLDRCPVGDGLWFDRGELHALLETAGAEGEGLTPLRSYLSGFATAGGVL